MPCPLQAHDAATDARRSVLLFNEYIKIMRDPTMVAAVSARVLAAEVKPSFSKLNPSWEGCCQGNKKTCTCGAPFFG